MAGTALIICVIVIFGHHVIIPFMPMHAGMTGRDGFPARDV